MGDAQRRYDMFYVSGGSCEGPDVWRTQRMKYHFVAELAVTNPKWVRAGPGDARQAGGLSDDAIAIARA